jgi:hypothetical protein
MELDHKIKVHTPHSRYEAREFPWVWRLLLEARIARKGEKVIDVASKGAGKASGPRQTNQGHFGFGKARAQGAQGWDRAEHVAETQGPKDGNAECSMGSLVEYMQGALRHAVQAGMDQASVMPRAASAPA